MDDIKKIKVDLQKMISRKFEFLSPYLVPEFFIIIRDPISNEESITFQYFNEEEPIEKKIDDDMTIEYGKTTKKILTIKNFKAEKFRKFIAHGKDNASFSNIDLVWRILLDHFFWKKP